MSKTGILTDTEKQEIITRIESSLGLEFEGEKQTGYKISKAHFENGLFLHSEQFYFAKRFFLNSNNCDDLAKLLIDKLEKAFNFSEETTLVGFRSYTGLLLNRTVNLLKEKEINNFNYEIIEYIDRESYLWQNNPPDLKKNVVIVLPITCTCSSFTKLRDFIRQYLKKKKLNKKIQVNNNFINAILILEESLKNKKVDEIKIRQPDNQDQNNLNEIYYPFDWRIISEDKIEFLDKNGNEYFGNPLAKLYLTLHLPQSCPLCFPPNKKSVDEKPLFPTYDNFETPNLIFGFPNFYNKNKPIDFFETFDSKDQNKRTHLYGHIIVKGSSYLNYIRGNNFYQNNKRKILSVFNETLAKAFLTKENKETKKVVFITIGNNHNSSFLEDLSNQDALKDKSVTILQFHPGREFVDNFISLHSKEIIDKQEEEIAGKTISRPKKIMIVYFEDVMSAGRTFKRVSDFIKHSRVNESKVTGRHGFDFVFTLVDRTPLYTRNEIIKKLFSSINEKPENNFISFFRLNVPIIAATHLPNPLQEKMEGLTEMINQCHLDGLKLTIAREFFKHKPRQLLDNNAEFDENSILKYFPFGNLVLREEVKDSSEIKLIYNEELYKQYQPKFKKQYADLLKLYLTHEINTYLAKEGVEKKSDNFVEDLIDAINEEIKPNIFKFFVITDDGNRDKKNELAVVKEAIIKILARPPFIYYKKIYEAIFNFCIRELDKLYEGLKQKEKENRSISFRDFRLLKFYLRRTVELNSSFIVSKRFIRGLRDFEGFHDRNNPKKIVDYHQESLEVLENDFSSGKIDKDFYNTAKNTIKYKLEQSTTYFSFLLLYYKELLFKNPAVSIKLEELLNTKELLPSELYSPKNTEVELKKLLTDLYYQFTGTLKAENVYLLNALKQLHKEKAKNEISKASESTFFDLEKIRQYYFDDNRTNTIVLHARKLIEKSRHNPVNPENTKSGLGKKENYDDVINSICQMLLTVSELEKKSADFATAKAPNLDGEIRLILNEALKIIKPLNDSNLKYAFFVAFRKKSEGMKTSEYIYSLIEDGVSNNQATVELDEKGLIYNMLYGLFDDENTKNPQTLITGVKLKNENVISFSDKYYIKVENNESEPLKFDEAYDRDCYKQTTRKGIELLSNSNMSIFLRLANIIPPKKTDEEPDLEGRAVLVITSNMDSNTENFVDFLSNEKIRLLLLIREELLDYLQKQFENAAFIEVIESKKTASYEKSLSHGLGQHISNLSSLFDKYETKIDDKKLFDYIKTAIDFQLGNLPFNRVDTLFISKKEIEEMLRLFFNAEEIGGYDIAFNEEIVVDLIQLEGILTNKLAFSAIMLEVVYNMKKYCPPMQNEDKGLSITYDKETNTICFKNKIYVKGKSSQRGLTLCSEIMNKWNLGVFNYEQTSDSYFVVTVTFTKS